MSYNNESHGDSSAPRLGSLSRDPSGTELEALKHEGVSVEVPRRFGAFDMPEVCCSCSAYASGQHSLRKWLNPLQSRGERGAEEAPQSSPSDAEKDGRPPISLWFPLCAECRKPFRWDRIGFIAGLVAIVLMETDRGLILTLLVLATLTLVQKMPDQVFRWLPIFWPLSFLRRREAVSQRVQLSHKGASLALRFSNGLFGYHFCRLNGIRGSQVVEGSKVPAALERYWGVDEGWSSQKPAGLPPIPDASFHPPGSAPASAPSTPPIPQVAALDAAAGRHARTERPAVPEPYVPETRSTGCLWHLPWIVGLAISIPLLRFRSAYSDFERPGFFGASMEDVLIGLAVDFSPYVAIPLLVFSLIYVGVPLVSKLLLRKPADTYDDWRSIKPKGDD